MDHGVVMSWLVRFKLNSRSICDGRKFIIFITKWIERCGSLSYYFRCCLILLLWLFTLLIQKTVWTDNALFTHAHLGPFLKKTVVNILAFKPIHGIVGMIDLSYLWRPVLLSKVLLEKLHRIIVREHTWHARRRWWSTHWFWHFTFRHWKQWLYERNSFGDRRQYYACIEFMLVIQEFRVFIGTAFNNGALIQLFGILFCWDVGSFRQLMIMIVACK